mmetsp:Transcript_12470/g.31776  ORF Transcript_12470/g.31776 Transcript_12470/m.31776 type:complete len:179 (+) Transcript_12470:166-702(+)
MASFQDWDEVSWSKTGRAAGVSKNKQLQSAARAGKLDAEKRYGAGGNKQSGTTVNMTALEESEELATEKVSLELRKALQQERQKAGLTQKELATACNVKATIIQDYEAGKGIPNTVMLGKIERAIKQKNPAFVTGTFTKAQKAALQKQKAKAKTLSAASASSGAAKPAAGPAARSRRF